MHGDARRLLARKFAAPLARLLGTRARSPHDRSRVEPKRQRDRPGLAKAREGPLVARRAIELVSVSAGRVRALIDDADVVSEGAIRRENDALVYYGTTSLVIAVRPENERPAIELDDLLAIVAVDPHLRVRALRIAHREAAVRGGPLGPMRAETGVRASSRGIVIEVDVVATVLAATTASGR